MSDETFDSKAEIQTPADVYSRWRSEIDEASKRASKWRKQTQKVIKRFRDEREKERETDSRFNILYSNIVTMASAVYQLPPRPDIRRRFSLDKTAGDPAAIKHAEMIGKKVSEVTERALSYCIDDYDFDEEMRGAIFDRLISGRGVIRCRYQPTVIDEAIAYEQAVSEYVYWDDVLLGPGRRWADVSWVSFRHMMTQEELVQAYGEDIAAEVSLTHTIAEDREQDADDSIFKRAEVFEIWDKETREVIWITRGYDRPLRIDPDPLQLEEFFPVCRPLFGITTTDSLEPIPDYVIYQDLAIELDDITRRISALTDALKVRGIYDAACESVGMLLEAEDNTLTPAPDAASLIDRGGLEAAVWFMPLDAITSVLQQLYQAREQVKQTIYEVMGIADLLRGSSNAAETATAQRVKAQFGTMRIDRVKRDVAAFARDVMRLKAEIIWKHFQPENLTKMTGIPVTPEMVALMRDDALRDFRIDIESESTIAPDEAAEQEQVTKLMTALVQATESIAPMVASGELPKQAGFELIRMALKPFKGARQIENLLDEAEGAQDRQEPEPPNPEQQLEEAKHQFTMAEEQAKHQNNMLKLQIEQAKLEREAMEIRLMPDGGAVGMPPPQPAAPPI